MYRTHTCGELRREHQGEKVTLSGWVQKIRKLGALTFVDIRDRFGITQLAFYEESNRELFDQANALGREFVIQITGVVHLRDSKNPNLPTGEIEVIPEKLRVLNPSKVPPFTIEDITDGGDELRMKYRYLDLRRNPLKNNLLLRYRIGMEVRKYLDALGFIDIETPFLIKSTPEGARDFVVPSRIHPGHFYALPQSPQTFKQLLMVAGFDRYYQIVRCFRDEDLRADRQPEFTQIDCEMAFVEQEDILQTFEGLIRHLIKEIKGVDVGSFPRMSYQEAMRRYGCDKPDIRFGMQFVELNDVVKGAGFKVFDEAQLVVAISVPGCADFTRKQLDELTEFIRRPQIGAGGLAWMRMDEHGLKSSFDKFYTPEQLAFIADKAHMKAGDLLLILAGPTSKTRKALHELRMHMAEKLGLRKPDEFAPLWVLDFPLLEWDEQTSRWHAMHHPFTSPKPEDAHLLDSDPSSVRANAYDMVLNGNEVGGGSIRIFDRDLQNKMFQILGFSEERARQQFGFLMNAFEYGAPPHGGIAFGFDRLVALLGGQEIIRDFIAFPKNNAGRDLMIDAPSQIDQEQLTELHISTLIFNS